MWSEVNFFLLNVLMKFGYIWVFKIIYEFAWLSFFLEIFSLLILFKVDIVYAFTFLTLIDVIHHNLHKL